MPTTNPRDVEYAFVLVEFSSDTNDDPKGQYEVNSLIRNGWAIASQLATSPRSMTVTLWRERNDY